MPWIKTSPPAENRHTLKARNLDAKAAKQLRKGRLSEASDTRHKANKAGRRGGWF